MGAMSACSCPEHNKHEALSSNPSTGKKKKKKKVSPKVGSRCPFLPPQASFIGKLQLTLALHVPLNGLESWGTSAAGDWLLSPLAIFPAVQAGAGTRGRNGVGHTASCHGYHKLPRHSFWEVGQVHDLLGALLIEEVQGQ
jgi:hypothetical protein